MQSRWTKTHVILVAVSCVVVGDTRRYPWNSLKRGGRHPVRQTHRSPTALSLAWRVPGPEGAVSLGCTVQLYPWVHGLAPAEAIGLAHTLPPVAEVAVDRDAVDADGEWVCPASANLCETTRVKAGGKVCNAQHMGMI